MIVEIVKAARIIRQIPEIYHSRTRSSLLSAISVRAGNRNIRANTDKKARIAVTFAEILSFFINLEWVIFIQIYEFSV